MVLDRQRVRARWPGAAGTAPLWWHPGSDIFDGQQINRFDVAATGTSSPVPPGIPRDPGPGQYYASPALAALLRSTPANQLAGRYPGRLAGTIGDVALPSPDSLVIIIGHTPAQLAHPPGQRAGDVDRHSGAGRHTDQSTPRAWTTPRPTRQPRRAPSTSSCPSSRWPCWPRC